MHNHRLVDLTQMHHSSTNGTGLLRIVLLFGSMAAALGLILIPILTEQYEASNNQSLFQHSIDQTVTGSIKSSAIPQQADVVINKNSQ